MPGWVTAASPAFMVTVMVVLAPGASLAVAGRLADSHRTLFPTRNRHNQGSTCVNAVGTLSAL